VREERGRGDAVDWHLDVLSFVFRHRRISQNEEQHQGAGQIRGQRGGMREDGRGFLHSYGMRGEGRGSSHG